MPGQPGFPAAVVQPAAPDAGVVFQSSGGSRTEHVVDRQGMMKWVTIEEVNVFFYQQLFSRFVRWKCQHRLLSGLESTGTVFK